jgi:hypothetical protein
MFFHHIYYFFSFSYISHIFSLFFSPFFLFLFL